ncbi:MAG: YkgJ family cysteine cluster protein [Tannerella sp.]|jgi:Fe-S-cluster containining protein|nr:YkgJ family cysteine cluster protein [Tannerella sp.]
MKNDYIETDLSKIKHLASVRENENIRFRTYLKGKDLIKVDRIVHQLHKEITGLIDCTLCGNCCRDLKPKLHKEDLARLAQLENTTPENYTDNYCEEDISGIFLHTMPCRYLEGKKCSIYESRPEECRHFPYTDKEKFIFRLWGMLGFYAICPIVFNLMERLKDRLRFY